MMTGRHKIARGMRTGVALFAFLALTACQQGAGIFGGASDGNAPAAIGSTRLVERDIEVPEVFQVTEEGLWDGRPSLGGVWVAHPDATDPERVIIRNEANGRFVIGALFRRERENPGPSLQVSSDAAAALNLIAGAPVTLNVTALRREEVSEIDPDADLTGGDAIEDVPTATAAAGEEITAIPLDAIAAASAAIDAVDASQPATSAAASAPTPAPAASSLERPYIQIGIFSVEENANNTGQALRGAGMVPTIYDQTSNGRRFWRVVVGPARSASERAALLTAVQGLGFEDAYFVTN